MTKDTGVNLHDTQRQARMIWIAVIVVSGIGLSTVFACATPFAAFATLAALKLDRGQAAVAVGAAWLANQAIGYAVLGYPWTWDSLAWGLAIGVSASVAVVAARGLSSSRAAPLAVSLPFVAAFAMFELGLYDFSFILPGGDGAFSASVVWHLFLLNATVLCVLMAAHHLVVLIHSLIRHDTSPYRIAGA